MALLTGTADRRWSALAVLVAAQFMVVLDVAIVNVALPSIQNDLHFSESSLQWVITAYAIMFGGVLLLGGRMADLLGRRSSSSPASALFTVSSLLAGFAWSAGSLIAFRATQGLGGALLAPAALSILMTMFAEGRERNLALGIWGAVSGSGAAAGVLLGGLLTSSLSWSWIFFINVPVGLASRRDRPAAPAREPRRPRSPALRLRRRNDRHRRADAPRVRPDPGHRDRLEHRRDDRPARRLRRSDHLVRRDRAALEGSAPPHADLPPAHARRRERRPRSCSARRSSRSSSSARSTCSRCWASPRSRLASPTSR